MEFRARPQNDYLLSAEWNELYILTEHWRSDMEFFSDELTFFHRLFDKYFQYLIAADNINETKAITAMLEHIKAQHTAISDLLGRHLIHISELMKNPFVQNEPQFRKEHAELEDRLVEFVKRFKDTKRKFFSIVERASKVEKEKHQLTN